MKAGEFRIIESRLDDLNQLLETATPQQAYFMGAVSSELREIPTRKILEAAAKCRDTKDLLLLITTLEGLKK